MMTRLISVLVFLDTTSSWSAAAVTATTTTTTLALGTSTPTILAFLTPTNPPGRQQRQLKLQTTTGTRGGTLLLAKRSARQQPGGSAKRRPPPPRPAASRAAVPSGSARRGGATQARRSDAPPGQRQEGEGQRAGGGGSISGSGVAMGSFLAACWASPARALAASAIVGDAGGGEMGARVDPAATSAFGLVALAFAFLQSRIRTAVKARTARRDYEVLFKGMKAKQLAGQAEEEEVALVEERMSQLVREEQEARMVDIFGIPFNLVIPDGGAGGEPGIGAREARQRQVRSGSANDTATGGSQQQERQLGIREAMKAKAESDMRDGRAREEEMSVGSTLKVAALWLVLISQLWLLVVLWNDPMGPASSAFLKD